MVVYYGPLILYYAAMKIMSFCRTVHAWGGFILALLILLISLTGSVLVWKKEYLWLTIPESRASAEITPELAATVTDAAQSHFGLDVLLLQFGHENLGLHKVYMPDSQYALLDSTGTIIDQWYLNDRPEEWLYDLHHRLLLGKHRPNGCRFICYSDVTIGVCRFNCLVAKPKIVQLAIMD